MDLREVTEFFKDTFKYIIVIAVVFLIVMYVVSFSQVSGNSMLPNYNDKDLMVLSKFHYNIFDVERSDVIAFESEGVRMLVKRVIGLPGDHIEYKDNILFINGESFKETYVGEFVTEDFKLEDLVGNYSVIPDDMYLVLGDNREDSYDSRNFGLVPKDDILGKCLLTVWPFSSFGVVS